MALIIEPGFGLVVRIGAKVAGVIIVPGVGIGVGIGLDVGVGTKMSVSKCR